ncbi:MAG: bifunctional protein-serine/threonine kinase/phosphatase [Burkholderiaceae bacterium]|nr:MAG: bifunctional protein-serine/threonine kinase/phosphatase [Burkholderiaceae bacterium]
MSFDLEFGRACEAGRKHPNEDCAAHAVGAGGDLGHGALAAIADGVSTGGLGGEAAYTTVGALLRDYFATPDTWDTTVALDRVILAHNLWLAGMNRRRQPALGLTTLTALVLRGQSYTLAHVGDTRAYLWRDGALQLLTVDHVVPHHDFRHQLTRSLGSDERLLVDYSVGDVLAGDRFVLLSDGVHGVLPERELRTLIARETPSAQALADALVQAALHAGSTDNLTALAVLVRGVSDGTLHDEERRARELPAPPRLAPGERIDGLEVEALLADTGSHLLYRVREAAPSSAPGLAPRRFVLKALHPQRAHDEVERAMLAHEAWVARRMQGGRARRHLAYLHAGPPGGAAASAFYLLYDWHAGETLAQMLARRHAFGVAQATELAVQAARVLGLLHRQGVVHRDVKPDNLHLGEDGVLRLLDLGVALTGREPEATRLLHAGTPSYMNPEQWPGYGPASQGGEALPPDARSDLFALGVTLYQLLGQGRLPYGEILPYQSGRYHRDPQPPSRHNPGVPIWLDHIALKAVARSPAQRFETAEELLLALERGASRPLALPPATPLAARTQVALWKVALAVSVLLNLLFVVWVLFLPR